MMRALLAMTMLLGASSAFAGAYAGRNDYGRNCTIYLTKLADGSARVALVDDTTSTGSVIADKKVVSSDGLVDTYIVGTSSVRMTVSVFKGAGIISASTFPMNYKGYCKADLK
jgi:hypothetical protein